MNLEYKHNNVCSLVKSCLLNSYSNRFPVSEPWEYEAGERERKKMYITMEKVSWFGEFFSVKKLLFFE